MGEDPVERVEEEIKEPVKQELETESGSVFSKKEVINGLLERVRWNPSSKKERIGKLYEDQRISRRKFLAMMGMGFGGAVLASNSIGYFMGTKIFDEGYGPTGAVTLNVSAGDVIDDVLADAVSSGNTVLIPPGTYAWERDAFPSSMDNATIKGDGGPAIFESSGSRGRDSIGDFSGKNLIENIYLQADQSESYSRDGHHIQRYDVDSGAVMELRNFAWMPKTEGSPHYSIYCGDGHAGHLILNGCTHINGPGGLYGSTPGKGENKDGRIDVINSYYENNNTYNIRLGGSKSQVRGSVIVVDDPAPRGDGKNAARGIWIREGDSGNGENIAIEDNDLCFDTGSTPIKIQPRDGGGSGVCNNNRIRNTDSDEAIDHDGGDWSGNGNQLTGSASDAPSGWVGCQGSGCEKAMCSDHPSPVANIDGLISGASGAQNSNNGPC